MNKCDDISYPQCVSLGCFKVIHVADGDAVCSRKSMTRSRSVCEKSANECRDTFT